MYEDTKGMADYIERNSCIIYLLLGKKAFHIIVD